jgi:glycosyltransferase involved in cell wall biosynthesis
MSKENSNLIVIVITHNRLEYTKRTIDSLLRTVPKANFVIFDNASTEEGFKEYLENLYINNKFQFIVGGFYENMGWGKAVNEALKEALRGADKDDLILLSNNDVEYFDGWFEQCTALYEKYPQIGILGVWKHTAHGIIEDKGDLIVKDQMPAVGWLMQQDKLKQIGTFPEHGPCDTKGGNGEDVTYCIMAAQKGFLVAAPKEDVANHIDGY